MTPHANGNLDAVVDAHGRALRYLRVSVTDRCNLRCRYCMPPQGIQMLQHEDIITYEEIASVARAAASIGVTSVRITGGEPLVRRGVVQLVEMLRGVPGLTDLSMTTNATLLAPAAESLARAGLNRVNISLDSLDPAQYAAITGGGDLRAALDGLEAALAAGLTPVKVNAVMLGGRDDNELRRWMEPFVKLAHRLPVHIRFIELMPVGGMTAGVVCGGAAIEAMRAFGAEPANDFVTGAGPARYFRLDGALGSLGLIAAMSDPFCDRCNRLRLSARGRVRSCLFAPPALDLMPLLRPRADVAAIARALSKCWRAKPSSRARPASDAADASMCQIGG